MLRKICLLLLIIAMLLSGCGSKEIKREVEIIDAVIVDSYHKSAWSQPILIGKTITIIPHPAEYKIIIEYDGMRKTISNQEFYYQYRNSIGETVKMNLITIYYDNGDISRKLERLN